MSVHDWTRIYASIFHDFHRSWAIQIHNQLNADLPPDHYAMLERVTVCEEADTPSVLVQDELVFGLLPPTTKNTVAVRHVSDDRVVAVIEIVSPGNKESRSGFRAFLDKTVDLLAKGVHLLIVDLFPPTARDPHGIHAAVLDEITGEDFVPPADEPLTLVAYEADRPPKAYIEPVKVGAALPDMPVFLKPDQCVMLPLEETYTSAFAAVPRRWRRVIDGERA